MHINPDFRTRLRECPGREGERFELLPAGDYQMSIQPPDGPTLDRSPAPALEDREYWKLAIYARDGTAATPSTHPRIFRDRLWRQYWIDRSWVPHVPTEVVQTLYDFLVLGPPRYEQVTTMR